MKEEGGLALQSLKVDGGAAANDYLMQTQADLTGAPVVRPRCLETTALGAAFLAGLAVGFWKNKEELLQIGGIEGIFQPNMEEEKRRDMIRGWKRAVRFSAGWAKEE